MGSGRGRSRQPAIAMIVGAGFAVAACSSGSSGGSAPDAGTGGSTPADSPAAASGPSPTTSAISTYRPDQATVIGKSTVVVVDPEVSAALKQTGVTVTAIAPATARATLRFPVSGGQIHVATLAGTVQHTGGLIFRHGHRTVTLTDLVINTKTRHVTAMVGRRSMPVFRLNLASPMGSSGRHHAVITSNIRLTVLPRAATALNSGLGVRTFRTGRRFGIATLTVAFAHGHR